MSWRLINTYTYILFRISLFMFFPPRPLGNYTLLLVLVSFLEGYFMCIYSWMFLCALWPRETKRKDREKEKRQRSLWSGGGECVKLLFIIIIIIISCGSLQQYKTTTWKGSFEKWWWLYIISSFHAHSNKLFIIKHLHQFSSNNTYTKSMKTRFRTYLR